MTAVQQPWLMRNVINSVKMEVKQTYQVGCHLQALVLLFTYYLEKYIIIMSVLNINKK